MQKCTLIRHPSTPCDAVQRIDADVVRYANTVQVRFRMVGDMARVQFPPVQAPQRQDELWRHTCCELFVRGDESSYHEFNFSPSTAWAAYAFANYRTGMTRADVTAPTIHVLAQPNTFELTAKIDLPAQSRYAALSCVVEESNGRISYWALAHAAGKPDFHHASGFALELKA